MAKKWESIVSNWAEQNEKGKEHHIDSISL